MLTSLSPAEDATDRSGGLGRAGREIADSRPISVGIGPIRFPGYLDRQEIMIRVEPNRFKILENERWAEPLDENFTRVLMQTCRYHFERTRSLSIHGLAIEKSSYRVDVEVLRFESNSASQAQLTARWTITDVNNNEKAVADELRVVRQAKDDSVGAAIAALSETVADVSSEITDALMREPDLRRRTTSESAASKQKQGTSVPRFENMPSFSFFQSSAKSTMTERGSARMAIPSTRGVASQ
jgi:uncharacterized lipoprotein YmbA